MPAVGLNRFEPRADETAGAAVARCAREALADGSMGCYVRAEDYEDFISCGFSPALAPPFSA